MRTLRILTAVTILVILMLTTSLVNESRTAAQTNTRFPSGLVDWWPGDGDANDSVGTHNGTLNGVTFAPGKNGQAFSFNGSGNVIDLGPDNIIGTVNASFTISWWMYMAPPEEWSYVYFMPVRFNQDTQFIISFVHNSVYFPSDSIYVGFRQQSHGRGMPINLALLSNSWNHITISYNGGDKSSASSYAFYINGQLLTAQKSDTGPVGQPCNENDNVIGSDINCGTSFAYFKGLMDDLQVYNRALTDQEVQQVFTATGGQTPTPTPISTPANTPTPTHASGLFPSGLVNWWQAEGDANDSVGTHNGTLNGVTFAPGKNGQAFSFNNPGDVINLGTDNIIGTGNAPLTISWWMYMAPPEEWSYVYVLPFRFNQDTQFIFEISREQGYPTPWMYASFRTHTSWIAPVNLTSLTNSWNFMSVSYNGGDKDLASSYNYYINGQLATDPRWNKGPVGQPCNENDNVIGSDINCGSNFAFFKGLMDDLQVYNRALTDQEVQQVFTATGGQTPIRQITALSPAIIWVGLKNSDDVGTKFDLLAEVYKDGTRVGHGEIDKVSGGSSGFNNARLNTIPLTLDTPADWPSGSTLHIKLYVRNTCFGNTHNSGTARLWYNDTAANSHFGATIGDSANSYFLLSGFSLGTSAGSGPKQTIDVAAGSPCSPFKLFGTWSTTP